MKTLTKELNCSNASEDRETIWRAVARFLNSDLHHGYDNYYYCNRKLSLFGGSAGWLWNGSSITRPLNSVLFGEDRRV